MSFADAIAAMDRNVIQHLGGVMVHYAEAFGDKAGDVVAVFEPNHVRPDPGSPGNNKVGPSLFLRASDLPVGLELGRAVWTVNGAEYRVRETEPDGHGGITLHLRAV